jgi:hypothetical protein
MFSGFPTFQTPNGMTKYALPIPMVALVATAVHKGIFLLIIH